MYASDPAAIADAPPWPSVRFLHDTLIKMSNRLSFATLRWFRWVSTDCRSFQQLDTAAVQGLLQQRNLSPNFFCGAINNSANRFGHIQLYFLMQFISLGIVFRKSVIAERDWEGKRRRRRKMWEEVVIFLEFSIHNSLNTVFEWSLPHHYCLFILLCSYHIISSIIRFPHV